MLRIYLAALDAVEAQAKAARQRGDMEVAEAIVRSAMASAEPAATRELHRHLAPIIRRISGAPLH